ncbi:MAG: hypothetical protein M1827_000369 [Pycnora praestabilis]|nr:MAG: hypothetical protein M1827_000369 [Pycnora praestabilis]
MPGRISTRSTRTSATSRPSASALSRKSSVQTLNSRASTASRISSPAITTPDEGPSSNLRTQICTIFADAQRSTAGHRKLAINLRKVQEACCYEPVKPRKDGGDAFNEGQFNEEVGRCVLRVMGVKKSESVGDRVIRFLGGFLKHATEKGRTSSIVEEILKNATELLTYIDNMVLSGNGADETEAFPETPSTRLTSHILSILLPLMMAKEKTVRYRSTQLISHIINSLDSIDDDLFQLLRLGLLKRIRDKESMVRVQAVLGLGRLAGNEAEEDQEDQDSDDEDAGRLLDKLLEVLQNDPSADVRRSLLLNLPLTPRTLPYLLERARDLDPATRRALYARLLPALGDFRHLSLSMREKLLRWGLRDRDENVRKAAGKLFRERWVEDCAGTHAVSEGGVVGETRPPSFDGLLELLERIDVINSGVESGVALEAMKEFWEGRPDYRNTATFDDAFWDALTPESIFMARSFNDFCRKEGGGKLEALVEEKMPEVTKLAFYLQRYTNSLVDSLRKSAEEAGGDEEDETVEQEFIVEQLLHITRTLDYTDEVGRRKMFSLLRETLAIPELPEEITRLAVEILRGLCGSDSTGERDFCGVVLEAVAEVHDNIMGDDIQEGDEGDESFHSAKSEVSEDTLTKAQKSKKSRSQGEQDEGQEGEEKVIREIMVNLKCLHIAQCMLQNVEGSLQQNVHLVTMLNNLVVPAVRSHEAPIRERGLLCLGLCCLLDKTLAEENLSLFLHCFNKGHDALQITSLQILSDIVTTHPTLLSPTPSPSSYSFPSDSATTTTPHPLQKPIHKLFSKALKPTSPPAVQITACTALSKLMLTSVLKDPDLLKQLVIAYFEPSSANNNNNNQGVRQALSYFLPVYCHSRLENMVRMGSIVLSVVHAVLGMQDEVDGEAGEEMVSMTVVVAHLADWTDGRKLVGGDSATEGKGDADAGDVHLDLAEEVLEKILAAGCSREERKHLTTLLSKLHIAPLAPTLSTQPRRQKIISIHALVTEAIDAKIATDAAGRNAFTKIEAVLGKVCGELELDGNAGAAEEKEEEEEEEKTVRHGEGETIVPGVFEKVEEDEAEEREGEGEGEIGVAGVAEETGLGLGMGMGMGGGDTVMQDSLLDELLDDDDDDDDGEEEEEEL